MHVYFLYIILVSIDPQNIESKTLSLSPQNQTAKPKALTLDPKPETKLMSGKPFGRKKKRDLLTVLRPYTLNQNSTPKP